MVLELSVKACLCPYWAMVSVPGPGMWDLDCMLVRPSRLVEYFCFASFVLIACARDVGFSFLIVLLLIR